MPKEEEQGRNKKQNMEGKSKRMKSEEGAIIG
jgi:hypothetical protein